MRSFLVLVQKFDHVVGLTNSGLLVFDQLTKEGPGFFQALTHGPVFFDVLRVNTLTVIVVVDLDDCIGGVDLLVFHGICVVHTIKLTYLYRKASKT